jgi:hypothetical protein
MGGINRREFIKNLSLATLGTALSPALLNVNVGKTFGVAPKSKVVISRHPEATADKGRKVNAEVVQNMMDTAAEHLTGQATVAIRGWLPQDPERYHEGSNVHWCV